MSKVNKTQLTATMRHKKVTKVLKMGNKILYARYKSNTQELFFGNTQVNNFFFFFGYLTSILKPKISRFRMKKSSKSKF